jgi:hypothetical protein
VLSKKDTTALLFNLGVNGNELEKEMIRVIPAVEEF